MDVTREVGDLVVRLADEHPLLTYARANGLECRAGTIANQDVGYIKVVTNGHGAPSTNDARFVCFFTMPDRGGMFGACTQIVVGDEVLADGPLLPDGISPAEAIGIVEGQCPSLS